MSRIPGTRLDRPTRTSVGTSAHGSAWQVAGASGEADDPEAPAVGVLALQGDVLEHVRALAGVGLRPVPVRRPADLEELRGLVLPGGESTAIARAVQRGGLAEPLTALIRSGMPVLGTCAGLILLSDELEGDELLARPGGLAVRTRRNAYGPQTASFDTAFEVRGLAGGPMHASFIRAPRIEAVLSPDVEVLAEVDGHAVAVRQGGLLAMSFHPEVSGDLRMHALLASSVHERSAR
jgi:5'-phosphate synthase pdxT subunit